MFKFVKQFRVSDPAPDWDGLWELASAQEGLFHVSNAREHGVSDAGLTLSKRTERVEGFRGVHRFKQSTSTRWFLNTAAYIWSKGEGVISHGSALDVWELSDWLPDRVEMTLPKRWKSRMISKQVLAFYDDLSEEDITWFEGFRVTTARRSVDDFIAWGIRPDLARQAVEQATRRGRPGGALFHRHQLCNYSMLVR